MKKKWFKIVEKGIQSLLFTSSLTTSITVILIIVFLFSEGIGLFFSKPIEKDSIIGISKYNPISKLSSEDLNHIFNQDVTNWKEYGGKNDSILLLSINNLSEYYTEEELGASFEFIPAKVNDFVEKHPGAIVSFSKTYMPQKFQGKYIEVKNVGVWQFLTGKLWYPTAQPVAQLGVLPLILGTLIVSFLAILLALPLGIACAIYLAEVANIRVRNTLKPLIELLAGIPSVVYGFFGLIVIVPAVQVIFKLPVGETAFSGSLVLAIMALPTIITVAEDALRSVPRTMKEASLALGASHWQTILRVCIPTAKSGIAAGIILGIGRAIGETMAVLMVTGNASTMPHSIFEPVRTIPATIAAELGETSAGGLHYKALFALSIILFIITFGINLSVSYVKSKNKSNS
jgi:phosphate transport system permease protein